jgi:hypothetical protein
MVRLKFKRAPTEQDAISETVLTTPVTFTAHFPLGAENLIGLLSARQLQVSEKWQPEPGKAKAGEAFIRTIRFAAPEIPAMAFPSFPVPQIDGLGIYRKDPEILDQSERGKLRGQRLDSITYVCQRPGHFVIPAVRLTWWDPDSKRLRTIDFPVRELEVAPNPAIPSTMPRGTTGKKRRSCFLTSIFRHFWGRLFRAVVFWQNARRIGRWLAPFQPTHLASLNPPGGK